jgi:hypothetical protein
MHSHASPVGVVDPMTSATAIPGPVDAAAPLLVVLNVGSGTDDALKTREIIEGVLIEAGLLVRIVVLFVFPAIANARRYIKMPQRDRKHYADQRCREMGFPRNPGLDR